jgi:hypothetical protein
MQNNEDNTCKLSNILCKIGIHNMDYTAVWIDKDLSIAIQEYTCTRCGKIAWNFSHFDANLCKVLTRTPMVDIDDIGKVTSESTTSTDSSAKENTATVNKTCESDKAEGTVGTDESGTSETKTTETTTA